MKLRILFGVVSISLALSPGGLLAYEIETHAKISEAAAQASILRDTSQNGVLHSLGLNYPVDDATHSQEFPNSKGTKENILSLIEDGARFEDDDTRSLNHFFDPTRGIGLKFGVYLGAPSPVWALEPDGPYNGQDFSYRDARRYFYRALTVPLEEERSRNFGEMFEGVGRLIHHLQDMAQPQHVRNDMHCKEIECSLLGLYNPSLYEKFTNEHRDELPLEPELASFDQARDFWANEGGTGIAQFTNRNFVSAGTNFVIFNGQPSPGADYPAPEPIISSDPPVDVQELFAENGLPGPTDQAGNPLHGDIVFVGSRVDGKLNRRASTLSLFDQDLTKYNTVVIYPGVELVETERLFTLNRFNFSSAYPFLAPKAVGYSAGMINYFFRGRIDLGIDYDSTTVGQYLIRNLGPEEMKGSFTLYYDAVDGKRYPVAGDESNVTWKDVIVPKADPNAPDGGRSVTLKPPILPSNPKPKRADEYFLVFKGEMGKEKPLDDGSMGAVVGKSKIKLLWEPWRDELTDNHPWRAFEGTVNHEVGPNSQGLEKGHLVLYSGTGGAGSVVWEATSAEDVISTRYMKVRLNCSQNALTEDFNVYGYLSVGPDLFSSQTIPFAGGVGASSSPYNLYPRATEQQEYIIDLIRIGGGQVGYLDINTIGFDTDLTCWFDYIDFSDKPFKHVADGAIRIPY